MPFGVDAHERKRDFVGAAQPECSGDKIADRLDFHSAGETNVTPSSQIPLY